MTLPQREAGEKAQTTLTCPRCLHHVTAVVSEEGGEATFTCPHCGYHGSVTAAESKEGHLMSDSHEVQRLLMAAAHAPTLHEAQQHVAAAEELRSQLQARVAAEREVDLSNAIVMDHLQPVAVHERHTAATDWLMDIATGPDDLQAMQHDVMAKAAVWYQRLSPVVQADADEFTQQAVGMAQHTAGRYGEQAPQAQATFLDYVEHLQRRASAPTMPSQEVFSTGIQYQGLPQGDTTSERAVNIQQLENNSSSTSGTDLTPVNDPGLGKADTQVDRANGDYGTTEVADLGQDKQAARTAARREGASMHTQCPTCGGQGRVAVRVAPLPTIEQIVTGQRHVGVSGLDQVDQTVDPHDNGPAPTPYPEQVAFPWTMQQGNVPQQQTANEAEQQIAQRDQMKGASRRQAAEAAARQAAQMAYRHVMAGQDDSGWMGDMGQGGVGPGQQDGGNPGGVTNLQMPDPVYGYGGDNGNQPLRPYGQDEANDYTNNPGMNWQPGQPTQADEGGRMNSTQAPPGGGAPGFPNPPINNGKKSSLVENDEQLQKALAFVRQRRALLESQQAPQRRAS